MANPYTNPDEPGFNPAYRGAPPWDIGRPQPDFMFPPDPAPIPDDTVAAST